MIRPVFVLITLITSLISLSSFSFEVLDDSDQFIVQLLGHNHKPKEVLVSYETDTRDFVRDLVNIITEINLKKSYSQNDQIKITLIGPDKKNIPFMPFNDYAKKNLINVIPYYGDRWLQDFAEIMFLPYKNTNDDDSLLVFDTNRGRGLDGLSEELAKKWNSSLYKTCEESSCGNYGGNIEVTPNNVLMIGNTSSLGLRDFFIQHGYQSNHIILDSSWLEVGHVDEYLSTIVIPNDPCGFAIVRADPLLAIELTKNASRDDLFDLPNDYQDSLHQTFVSFYSYLKSGTDDRDQEMKSLLNSQSLIDQIIALNVKKLKQEIVKKSPHCKDIKEVRFPVLYQCRSFNNEIDNCGALLPNAVNMLVLEDQLIIPEPFFHPFRNAIREAASHVGNTAHFIDNYLPYHVQAGSVHCGTNTLRASNKLINPNIF